MKVLHTDHIGIVVNDLEAASNFFLDLGFMILGQDKVQGEWVDRIIGLKDVRSELVMLQAPDAQLNIELARFHQPVDPVGVQPVPANRLGIRHIAFQVDDVEAIVNDLHQKGRELIGEVQTYKKSWKLCYVRGPEGIIIELAEKMDGK